MKKNFFLISASGKDRPGIVAGVTEILYKLGGNLQDASMTRLGGEFAIMVVVGVPEPLAKVQKAFRALEKRFKLHVSTSPLSPGDARGGKRTEAGFLLSVYGTDQPGIVYQITKALAARKVSVTDLQTKSVAGTESSLYVMLLEIQVPDGLNLDELREDLDKLRQELEVDITLQELSPIAL